MNLLTNDVGVDDDSENSGTTWLKNHYGPVDAAIAMTVMMTVTVTMTKTKMAMTPSTVMTRLTYNRGTRFPPAVYSLLTGESRLGFPV